MLKIREMTPQDAEAVRNIFTGCFSHPWSLESIESMFTTGGYVNMVAEEDGRPVGYAGYLAVADEADIVNVAVDPSCQHRRIGTNVMAALLDAARRSGICQIFLEVRPSNVPAIRLYEGMGFERISIRKNYYEAPREDALIMVWKNEV